jgi:GTP-binding protein
MINKISSSGRQIIVAMDGPSGSGKSSTSKGLAMRAGWSYLDTGALYRAATWLSLEKKLNTPSALIAALRNDPIKFITDPKNPCVFVGAKELTT